MGKLFDFCSMFVDSLQDVNDIPLYRLYQVGGGKYHTRVDLFLQLILYNACGNMST
jgi:hypothetical protein